MYHEERYFCLEFADTGGEVKEAAEPLHHFGLIEESGNVYRAGVRVLNGANSLFVDKV